MTGAKLWIFLIVSLVFNAGGNISLKAGMKSMPINGSILQLSTILILLQHPLILLGLALFTVSFVGYSLVLSGMSLSLAYPIMTGGGFVIVVLASLILFAEEASLLRILGIMFIIAGIWIASRY